jgi:hypothetical protein
MVDGAGIILVERKAKKHGEKVDDTQGCAHNVGRKEED